LLLGRRGGNGDDAGEEKRIRPAEMRSEVVPRMLRSGEKGKRKRNGGVSRSGRNMNMSVYRAFCWVFCWWRLDIKFSCSGAEKVSQEYQKGEMTRRGA
jgi:hypothetical protein